MSVQHLFKFQTESDYKTAKNNHLIIPNISNVIESGKTYISSKFSTKETAEVGDIIVFHEETDGTKTIRDMKPEAFDRTDDYWTADAIVVVPYNHTNDGTVRAMAINRASVTNPEEGTYLGEYIIWGAKYEIDGLKIYGGKTVFSSVQDQTSESTSGVEAYNNNGYLPVDNPAFEIHNPFDEETYYINRNAYSSSPYNNDGTPNDSYHSAGAFSTFTENPMQDMDGSVNTLKILKSLNQDYLSETLYAQTLDNGQTKTIEVDGEDVVLDLYPLVSACARYSSVLKPCSFDPSKTLEENIATMPWYCPSAGELGYVVVRQNKLRFALEQITGNEETRKQLVGSSTVGILEPSFKEGFLAIGTVNDDWTDYKEVDIDYCSALPFCKF